MDATKMTTSQMIEFLQAYEHGGASGRARDITFWINGRPYDLIGLIGTGDGLVTSISIKLGRSNKVKKPQPQPAQTSTFG